LVSCSSTRSFRRVTRLGSKPCSPAPIRIYDSKPASSKVVDLGRYIDHNRKVVRSNTGQIRFDYGRGLCTIDARAAQGATGFLKTAGPLVLSAVTVDSENAYATVLVDLNGNARGVLKAVASGATLKLTLPRDAMYVVLKSE